MNPGASGGFDISSLTRQMPAIASGHQAQSAHHLHHHATAFGHQPQHQPLHQPMHQPHHHHHMQQQPVHHPHPLLLPNMGLGNAILSPGLHHQPGPLQPVPGHHPAHHLHAAGDSLHHFTPPAHVLHHQPAAQPMQQQLHAAGPAPHHPQPHPHLVHSPQSLPPAHHPAAPAARVMPEATNALASSVNLSSIQSLVDVLTELPLPSESPEVVSAAARLITPEQHANMQQTAMSSMEQQHTLSQNLVAAMRTAKQQLSQLNMTFKQKKAGASRDRSSGSGDPVSFSRYHRDNSFLLSLLQQMDALTPDAAVPPVTPDAQLPQSRSQNQYWSPWSGNETGPAAPVQQPLPPHSPYVSSPSYPMRGSAVSQTTVVYNDNSNSSSSFSAEPVTPSAMTTPPSHQSQQIHQQVHNQPQQQYHLPAPPPDQTAVKQDDSNYYEQTEPVVVLERSELMEKALQEYYANANASNGAPDLCP